VQCSRFIFLCVFIRDNVWDHLILQRDFRFFRYRTRIIQI
jgi:hypothetical protein